MIVIHNAIMVNEGTMAPGYVVVDGTRIILTGSGKAPAELLTMHGAEIVDLEGRYLMPGMIDAHVHFREPGMTEKGDIASESQAAIAGGVTSCLEMPNTRPATTTRELWQHKMDIAADRSLTNYAFFLGATNDNLPELMAADYTRVPGVKLFLGSSTGNMLVDDRDTLSRIFATIKTTMVVHAESETIIAANRERLRSSMGDDIPLEYHSEIRDRRACFEAAKGAVEMARKTGARLHIAHITTADELALLTDAPVDDKRITAETCPHYLLYTAADMKQMGARIKCNPAIKDAADRKALIEAVADGLIDTIGSDHAPHLTASKQGNALTAASGMPGVQHMLPVVLDIFGALTAVEKMAHNPARIFGIDDRGFITPGYFADLTVVEQLPDGIAISDADAVSRCGWTPYHGYVTHHRVTDVMVGGLWAMRQRSLTGISGASALTFTPRK